MSALQTQVGGDHYKTLAIQPVEYITRNGLGFVEGSVIKYVTRHKAKGGAEDIKKAIHFLNLLLELEYGEKEETADQCKARFSHLKKHEGGMVFAVLFDHDGHEHLGSKDVVKEWSENLKCSDCKAAMSLALVQLTKP